MKTFFVKKSRFNVSTYYIQHWMKKYQYLFETVCTTGTGKELFLYFIGPLIMMVSYLVHSLMSFQKIN